MENTFTQIQINNANKQNVDFNTVSIDKKDDGTYTLVGYDKTTNKLVELGAPTTEQITKYENTQKIEQKELESQELTNTNTPAHLKGAKEKFQSIQSAYEQIKASRGF